MDKIWVRPCLRNNNKINIKRSIYPMVLHISKYKTETIIFTIRITQYIILIC